MAKIDLILLIPIAIGAFNGYRKGLIIEIVGLLAFFLAIVLGFKFLGVGMDFISGFIGDQYSGRMLPYLSFLLIFFPTIFFVNKIGWLLRKSLRVTIFGTLDGLAGAAVGSLLWFFGLSLLLWIFSKVGLEIPQSYASESEVLPVLKDFAPKLISKISDLIPAGGNLIDRLKGLQESGVDVI